MTIPTLANLPVYQNNYYSLMRIFPKFQECATVIEDFLKKIIEAGDIYIRVYRMYGALHPLSSFAWIHLDERYDRLRM